MDIIIGLIQDLNRHFRNNLTLMVDGESMVLFFFSTNKILLRTNKTYDLYKALSKLKDMVSTYTNCAVSTNSEREMRYLSQCIYRDYNFDINQEFEIRKHGKK